MGHEVTRRRFIKTSAAATALLSSDMLFGCGQDAPTGTENTESAQVALEPEINDPTSPWWLQGNYAPIEGESTSSALEVVGEIPEGLNGTYLRNGPNPLNGDSGHWFLGDGMVHGVRLEGGQAQSYQNRYIQTDILHGGSQGGIPTLAGHQANTSLIYHHERLLSLSEVGLPYEISRDDFSTHGVFDFGGNLTTPMTAHPKIDPITGEMLFFGYNWQAPYLTYHIASASGELTKSEAIAIPGASMQHDFAITQTRTVFMDLPLLFNLDAAMQGESLPFSWTPSYGSRIGVMPRYGTNSNVRWFEIENCFVFHTANAYDDPESPDTVVLEGYRFADFSFDESIARPERSHGNLWRWYLNTATGEVREEQLLDWFADFPMVDARFLGSPHRYLFSVQFDLQNYLETEGGFVGRAEGIQRFDRESGEVQLHRFGPQFQSDEAFFVPRSVDADEADGWLLSYVYDRARQTSALAILDATNLEGEAVGMVYMPQRIPHGFHGTWLPKL